MADLTKLGCGALQAAETLLRGVGGRSVLVRTPQAGAMDGVTDQLGLAAAEFADVEIAPCVLRLLSASGEMRQELQVAARAVTTAAGGSDPALVLAWFAAAAGVVVDGELLRVLDVTYRDLAGVPYVYRLELAGAAAAEI